VGNFDGKKWRLTLEATDLQYEILAKQQLPSMNQKNY
jgi:hypothetical protein